MIFTYVTGTLKPDDAQNLAKILEVFGKHSAAAQVSPVHPC